MKFGSFRGEKLNTILAFKLTNGLGWLTTDRLIIEQEKFNPNLNEVSKQTPKTYPLRDFEKAVLEDKTLVIHFRGSRKAMIHLQHYSSSVIREIQACIEQAGRYSR